MCRRPRVAILSTGDEIVPPARRCRWAPSTTPTPRSSAPRSPSSAASRCTSASCPTTTTRCAEALARGAAVRRGAAVGRHLQGRGRSVVSRREPARRPGHRRARRRAQAGQADLPGGEPGQAGGDPAGLSDLGDLHVPRVRRAGDPRVRRPAARAARDGDGHAADAGQLRARAHRVPAGRPGAGRGRRCAPTRWARAPGRSRPSAAPTASSPSTSTPRSSTPAPRCRCSCWRSAWSRRTWWSSAATASGSTPWSAELIRQGIRAKVLYVGSMGGLDGRQARRVRHRRRPPDGPGSGEYNRPLLTDDADARAGLPAHAGDRVPPRRRALSGKAVRRRGGRSAGRSRHARWSTATPAAARGC